MNIKTLYQVVSCGLTPRYYTVSLGLVYYFIVGRIILYKLGLSCAKLSPAKASFILANGLLPNYPIASGG